MKSAILVVVSAGLIATAADSMDHHHHHHGHHHKHGDDGQKSLSPVLTASQDKPGTKVVAVMPGAASVVVNSIQKNNAQSEEQIVSKMKKLEGDLARTTSPSEHAVGKGHLEVNGPLPADFAERFTQSVGSATDCDPREVKVLRLSPSKEGGKIHDLDFEAPQAVVEAVENQAADPESKLANGPMRLFLQAGSSQAIEAIAPAKVPMERDPEAPMPKGLDVDTEMPYGELEPFGREDTAQELTERSINESDQMVDQLERAAVAEEKRSVFRALTRLRGAAITSYDGVARSQTGNIDEYNKIHKWRRTHPLHHLADEESDVSKWAFPDNAD